MVALRLGVGRLLLVVVHRRLLVVRPAVLLEASLRQNTVAVRSAGSVRGRWRVVAIATAVVMLRSTHQQHHRQRGTSGRWRVAGGSTVAIGARLAVVLML